MILLIRGASKENCLSRLNKKMSLYFGEKFLDSYKGRFDVLCGDFTMSNLGLNDDEYHYLSNNIDRIINAAANTKHFGKYTGFKKANVDGVVNLINLCKKSNHVVFDHISTKSTFDTYNDYEKIPIFLKSHH